jgi:hypothetical protein
MAMIVMFQQDSVVSFTTTATNWVVETVPWTELSGHLLFGLSCALLAGIMVFVDRMMLRHTGRSLLDMTFETGWKAVGDLLGWCAAAAIVGGLASGLQVLQQTILAAVVTAVGWPIIYGKIIELAKTPVQQPTAQEE